MPDPYAIEPEPMVPNLPGQTVIRENEDQVLDALAAEVYVHSLDCVRRFGDFHIAIAAGRFQERLCTRLMTDPAVRMLPWSRTHVWASTAWAGPGGRSSFSGIVDLLADHAGIPAGRLHIPDHAHEDPAGEYERRIQHVLAWREKGHDRLDLVVLALEPGGGFAGIADPCRAEVNREISGRQGPWLIAPVRDDREGSSACGITMTATLINATRLIAVGATGGHLRPVFDSAREGAPPGPGIRPIGGTLRWYLDREACPQ